MRWVVPAGVTAVVLGAGGIADMLPAGAAEPLPPRSAQQLLLDVQEARSTGLSGTVVQRTDTGLPELPRSGSSDLISLVSGNHTLRLWYSGPRKTRVALLGTLGESDVIRNGRDLWVWSSRDKTATHALLPDAQKVLEQAEKSRRSKENALGVPIPSPSELTPQAISGEILKAMEPTTAVSTAGPVKIAGERAYELVLAPRDPDSLVGRVKIAVEAVHHVPIRLQVLPRTGSSPAFEIAFTQISFDRPSESHFQFTPPSEAKLRELSMDQQPSRTEQGSTAQTPVVIGKGWTSVVAGRLSDGSLQKFLSREITGQESGSTDSDASGSESNGWGSTGGLQAADRLFQAFRNVSGSWGKGRLIESNLCSILVTDDGRFYAGAVRPGALYKVAAEPLPASGGGR